MESKTPPKFWAQHGYLIAGVLVVLAAAVALAALQVHGSRIGRDADTAAFLA